jgi:hypothetical protein
LRSEHVLLEYVFGLDLVRVFPARLPQVPVSAAIYILQPYASVARVAAGELVCSPSAAPLARRTLSPLPKTKFGLSGRNLWTT